MPNGQSKKLHTKPEVIIKNNEICRRTAWGGGRGKENGKHPE